MYFRIFKKKNMQNTILTCKWTWNLPVDWAKPAAQQIAKTLYIKAIMIITIVSILKFQYTTTCQKLRKITLDLNEIPREFYGYYTHYMTRMKCLVNAGEVWSR